MIDWLIDKCLRRIRSIAVLKRWWSIAPKQNGRMIWRVNFLTYVPCTASPIGWNISGPWSQYRYRVVVLEIEYCTHYMIITSHQNCFVFAKKNKQTTNKEIKRNKNKFLKNFFRVVFEKLKLLSHIFIIITYSNATQTIPFKHGFQTF